MLTLKRVQGDPPVSISILPSTVMLTKVSISILPSTVMLTKVSISIPHQIFLYITREN